MATISRLKRKKGTVYRAQVRIKRNGHIIYNEAATFSTRAAARRWGETRDAELKVPGALEQATTTRTHGAVTLGSLIEDYLTENAHSFGRTKTSHLRMMKGFALAELTLAELSTEALLDHLRLRRQDVAPSTAGIDLTWLRIVLEHARLAWGFDIDLSILDDARLIARKSRLTGRPRQRDRRPTSDELRQLHQWFQHPHIGPGKSSALPMNDLIDFAIASARRQSEITRLRWSDLNERKHICLIRDLKNPDGSKGNHRTFALTKAALKIIRRQPRTGPRIFPYEPKTIGTYFTRACKLLGIPDLKFHDLRHEATSRLFEAGYQIQEVQQFTLHDQWSTLQRYTQLRPEDISGK